MVNTAGLILIDFKKLCLFGKGIGRLIDITLKIIKALL